jgi:S1-C subfamily serine protease
MAAYPAAHVVHMHAFALSRFLFWFVIFFLAALAARPWLERALVAYRAEPREITARGDLASDEQTTIAIFEATSPSVVYITTTGRVLDLLTRNVTEVPRGTGSGVIWDERGHVVTNHHVVEGVQGAYVRMSDQRNYDAVLVGVSPEYDLAVLRIDAPSSSLHAVPLGTSRDLKVGQKVVAIGNPFGLDYTLTTGVISALNRTIPTESGGVIEHLIQTDAAINPGNSGGPLIDSAGRLIGINTAIFSPSGSSAGIGFAVPVDTVNRIVPQLIAYGRYVRPSLGIAADDDVSERVLGEVGLSGILVLKVEQGSPAAKAGLQAARVARNGDLILGDVIRAVDGKAVDSVNALIALLEGYSVGDRVVLTIHRNGSEVPVSVQLGPGPRATGVGETLVGHTQIVRHDQASGAPCVTPSGHHAA